MSWGDWATVELALALANVAILAKFGWTRDGGRGALSNALVGAAAVICATVGGLYLGYVMIERGGYAIEFEEEGVRVGINAPTPTPDWIETEADD